MENIEAIIQAERQRQSITVLKRLSNPHRLIALTQAIPEQKSRVDEYGVKRFKLDVKRYVDIRVSQDSLSRALRIMDALIKALEARGYKVSLSDANKHCAIHAVIFGQEMGFHIREYTKRSEHGYLEDRRRRGLSVSKYEEQEYKDRKAYSYSPTGILALISDNSTEGNRHEWKDSKKHVLEDCLNDVIQSLMLSAHARNIRDAKWAEQSRQWQEQRRLKEEEQKRIEQLEAMFAQWQKSQQMKKFLEAFEEHHAGALMQQEMRDWLAWAKSYAEHVNPIAANAKNFRLTV